MSSGGFGDDIGAGTEERRRRPRAGRRPERRARRPPRASPISAVTSGHGHREHRLVDLRLRGRRRERRRRDRRGRGDARRRRGGARRGQAQQPEQDLPPLGARAEGARRLPLHRGRLDHELRPRRRRRSTTSSRPGRSRSINSTRSSTRGGRPVQEGLVVLPWQRGVRGQRRGPSAASPSPTTRRCSCRAPR